MHMLINCDLGEGFAHDADIMPMLHAVNIACGYHAGDENTIRNTIRLALKNNVSIGAHPSFADRDSFGRKEIFMMDAELFELIKAQLHCIGDIAASEGATLSHIKPHGALYNLSARNVNTAQIIARAVRAYDPSLTLFGLSGSCSLEAAEKLGLKTAHEIFADRGYLDDGTLAPRSIKNSVHENAAVVKEQAKQVMTESTIVSMNGKSLSLKADTICIHGDGPHALEFAQAVRDVFNSHS
jgi:UPF0271 protein